MSALVVNQSMCCHVWLLMTLPCNVTNVSLYEACLQQHFPNTRIHEEKWHIKSQVFSQTIVSFSVESFSMLSIYDSCVHIKELWSMLPINIYQNQFVNMLLIITLWTLKTSSVAAVLVFYILYELDTLQFPIKDCAFKGWRLQCQLQTTHVPTLYVCQGTIYIGKSWKKSALPVCIHCQYLDKLCINSRYQHDCYIPSSETFHVL